MKRAAARVEGPFWQIRGGPFNLGWSADQDDVDFTRAVDAGDEPQLDVAGLARAGDQGDARREPLSPSPLVGEGRGGGAGADITPTPTLPHQGGGSGGGRPHQGGGRGRGRPHRR